MKWLEMIKVQTAAGHESRAEGELRAMIKDIRKTYNTTDMQEVVLYDHASIPGCFTVQLTWDTNTPEFQGSLLGLRLTQSVKTFGLVDHSVWIEKHR